jgi:hypothetical protein
MFVSILFDQLTVPSREKLGENNFYLMSEMIDDR